MSSKKESRGSRMFGKAKNKKKKSVKKSHTPFWSSYIKTNGKKTYVLHEALLSDYLVANRYYRNNDFSEPQVVKLDDNILYIKSAQEVVNDVLKHVTLENDDELRSCFIKQGEDMLQKRKAILGSLPKLTIKRYKDSKKCVRLFYIDKVVLVTKKGFQMTTYKKFRKLNQYIYSEQIIQRNFNQQENNKSEFSRFLKLATKDKKHFKAICTALGYLISSYKNPSLAKAVIITDILSQVNNEAFGRSGKGILIKALSHIIEVVEYNGKVTDLTTDKFVFQNVTVSTALIVLQDVTKNFLFESLFSTLTDNMSIERKHRSKISISFHNSPKVALTTNYTIPQDTDSFKDRKHLVTLNNFFNATNKPEKHLKKLLFEWNENEWASFDSFMIGCVNLFLKKGLMAYDSADLKKQKLINLTSLEFFELMECGYDNLNEYWSIKQIAAKVEVGTQEKSAKSRITSKWIDSYAAFKGYKIDRRQSGGITKICFTA